MQETKYRDTMPAEIIKLMSEGKSRVQVASAWGICKDTLGLWANDPNKPEFVLAYKIAKTACEAYHEEVGQKGAKGLYPKFNYPAWAKGMGARFKDDWAETSTQKIELKNELKSMSNEEIDQTIKTLLAQRSLNKPKEEEKG